ncbi:MAG: IS1595 family transposase [Xanthobacteraceae bacterium]|uniref:IS1595 family transposase n=1 Tax=Pseudolabrys sp. TaxID=1960880 RepID=UPI003D0C4CA3
MDTFSAPHFRDDQAARAYLEGVLWPEGPVCPHCGVINHAYATKRPGVFRCAESKCRKDFTVTMRTVMERSKIPLHKWLQAFHMMCASKKGVSAHQIHRTLGIGYEAAWFMCHRIREAMRDGGLSPLGGEGQIVEADETYFGKVDKANRRTKTTSGRPFTKGGRASNNRPIVSLVERGGNVRSFHVAVADAENVANIVNENIMRESRLHTDESRLYTKVGANFAKHETVNHSGKEYARGDVTTNTVEGYFSIFKRGMRGVYQHCGEKHLHRYLAEYDFRFNHRIKLGFNDGDRATLAVKGAAGKRLTYRGPH